MRAAAPAASYTGGTPGGGFGTCVIQRESGGNAQVMNSSGHYGLYQFSASTWAAYGGNPASFGNASVAQQNQVFSNAMRPGRPVQLVGLRRLLTRSASGQAAGWPSPAACPPVPGRGYSLAPRPETCVAGLPIHTVLMLQNSRMPW